MAAGDQATLKVNLLADNQDASVELSSNSPDLDEFVGKIVKYKEEIDTEKITVTCDDEKFDTNSFKEIIVTSIKNFLEKVSLEQQAFETEIARLEAQATHNRSCNKSL